MTSWFHEVWRADVPAHETRGSLDHLLGSFSTSEDAESFKSHLEVLNPRRSFKIMRRPRPLNTEIKMGDATGRGYTAWNDDVPLTANPFDADKSPVEFAMWREGWLAAREDNSQFGLGA